MGREWNTESRMRTLSCALGVHFCLIFSFSFLTSIFHRFVLDFGEILVGFWHPKWSQNRNFWYFFGYVCGVFIFSRILLDF